MGVFVNRVAMKDPADAASYEAPLSPGTWTPVADKVHLISVMSRATAAPNVPTLSGNGLTYTQKKTILSTGDVWRLTVFEAHGAAPTAGRITIDFGGQTQTGCILICDENTDGNPADPLNLANAAEVNDSGFESLTVTLPSAVAGGNAIWMTGGSNQNTALTGDAGYSILANLQDGGTARALLTQYDADGSDLSATFASPGDAGRLVGWSVEVKIAGGGGAEDKAGSDSGAGTDAGSVTAALAPADTGAGTDAGTPAGALSVSDSGTGVDAVSAGVPIDVADAGTGADAVSAVTEPAPASDTGAGAETGVVAAAAAVTEAGAGVDAGFLSAADHFVPDVGTGAEAAIIGLLAAELGIGVDAVSVAVQAPDDWSILVEDESAVMVERKEWVRPFPALLVENRSLGGSGAASIPLFDRLRELDLEGGRRVRVIHRGVELYEGFVRVLRTADNGWTDGPLLYLLECQDFSTLAEDDVIETAFRSVAESDKARIAWLVSTFGTKGITAGAEVQQLVAQMPPGEDGRPEQDFSAKTLGEAIDQVLAISGGQWYVDSDKRLHTFKVELSPAPFNVSDVPDGVTTQPYGQLVLIDDTIDERHRVLVAGTGVKIWREVSPLPAQADKIREGVVRDPDITTVVQAEAVGDAYLDRHAPRRSGSFICYEPGLRAGQTIEISHLGMGLDEEPFIIRAVRVQPIADKTEWHVEFGDTALDLSEVIYDLRQRVTIVTGQASEVQVDLLELQAAGANLIPDSSFEASTPAAWEVGTGWTHGFASANAHRGSKVARLVRSNQAAGILRTAGFTPIARTEQYLVSAWSLLSALGTNAQGEIYVEEYNAASSLLATTVIATIAAVETAKTRHSARFGPDAGVGRIAWQATTAKVKVGFRAGGSDTTPTITWDVDAVQLERGRLLTAYAPAPEELYNVPGEVVIDENGVTIINGALTVKNPGGTVIIDGTSDMFRIVATGTLSLPTLASPQAIARQGDSVAVDSTSNQSIPSSSTNFTVLDFQHERIDDGAVTGYHSGSQSKLIVPAGAAGWYWIWGQARWEFNASGSRGLLIALNGDTTGVGRIGLVLGPPGVGASQQVGSYRHLDEGDEVELYAFQNSGGPLNIEKALDYSAEFGMVLLRVDNQGTFKSSAGVLVNLNTGLTYPPAHLGFVEFGTSARALPFFVTVAEGAGPLAVMVAMAVAASGATTNVSFGYAQWDPFVLDGSPWDVRYYLMEQVAI